MLKKVFKGMNVRLQGIIIGLVVSSLLFGTTVFASQVGQTISVIYNNIKIVIDGKPFTPTDAQGNIIEPFIYNGITYLPVRAVAEAVGKAVSWDGKTGTVYLGKNDGQTPVDNLTNLPVFEGDGFTFDPGGYTDNTGVLHHPAAEENIYYSANGSNTYSGTYLLNMKYSRLTGNVSLPSYDKNTTANVYLNIYGDGKLLYTSQDITAGSYPQDFNVDVSGVIQLKVELSYQSASNGESSAGFILSGLDLYS